MEYDNDCYKSILFMDSGTRDWSEHSMEWCHSREQNNWLGWYCGAGARSLYIDFDGNAFAGTCEVGGWYGNVFRDGFHPDKDLKGWVRCTKKICACGPDMYSPKVKDKALTSKNQHELLWFLKHRNQTLKTEQLNNPDMVLCENGLSYKTVIWDLGRRCNYACSYCYPGSHNNYEAHKTIGSLRHAVDVISDQWQCGERGIFLVTGGEPTINPHYLEFVQYVKAKNPENMINTSTNGSRTPDYYAQLYPISGINFSAHLEFLQNAHAYQRFIENVRTCSEIKRNGTTSYFQVRIMLKPGFLDLATRLRNDLLSIPGILQHAKIMTSLLHQSDAKSIDRQYNEEEKRFVFENVSP